MEEFTAEAKAFPSGFNSTIEHCLKYNRHILEQIEKYLTQNEYQKLLNHIEGLLPA
jgi:hypothetical protein